MNLSILSVMTLIITLMFMGVVARLTKILKSREEDEATDSEASAYECGTWGSEDNSKVSASAFTVFCVMYLIVDLELAFIYPVVATVLDQPTTMFPMIYVLLFFIMFYEYEVKALFSWTI